MVNSFRSVTGKDIGLKIMESSMSLGTLGNKEDPGTVSDIRKLFSDGEKSHKNGFTVSNVSTPVISNIDPNMAVRHKKKSSKLKGILLHKKSKQHLIGAENVYNANDVLSSSSERRTGSKMKMHTDNDGDDDDDSTSLQTVKNMKIDSTIEGVEDKRLRDIILRMDRVLLAAMPARNT